MKHKITDKMRAHIARNVRLSRELYGPSAAAQFAFDAIAFCMDHDRDVEFAGILEKSNPQLLSMAVELERPNARLLLERNAAPFVVDIHVESNHVNEITMPAAVVKPSTPVSEWQGFGW